MIGAIVSVYSPCLWALAPGPEPACSSRCSATPRRPGGPNRRYGAGFSGWQQWPVSRIGVLDRTWHGVPSTIMTGMLGPSGEPGGCSAALAGVAAAASAALMPGRDVGAARLLAASSAAPPVRTDASVRRGVSLTSLSAEDEKSMSGAEPRRAGVAAAF